MLNATHTDTDAILRIQFNQLSAWNANTGKIDQRWATVNDIAAILKTHPHLGRHAQRLPDWAKSACNCCEKDVTAVFQIFGARFCLPCMKSAKRKM